MLQRITGFLRRMFRGLRPPSFPHTEQAQSIWMQDMKPVYTIITRESDLKETGPLVAIPRLERERITEPCRAIRRWQRPAERYRELDAMLVELQRDRLLNSETMLLPMPARQLAHRLYREIEQEVGNER